MKFLPLAALQGALILVMSGCAEAPDNASADGAPAAPAHPGERIYGEYCFSCHTPGLNGAPRLGDKAAWAPIAERGMASMLAATIEGIPPAMPPRGICMSCSDEELEAAIDYMVVNSQ